MDETSEFRQVYDLFLRPEAIAWRIIREDGDEEEFDPLTLIDSFIESEVPLHHAFTIFDHFRKKAAERFPDKRVTHAEIHAWVSEAFLAYPHQDRTVWFANYENVFSPELVTPVAEEGFVFARKMGEMKKILIELLDKEFGMTVSHRVDQPSARPITSDQLDNAVRRIIKLVRQCGFYKLPVTFLRDFCRELAEHSSKLYLPAGRMPPETLRGRLKTAEESIALSRLHFQNSGLSMLQIAARVMSVTWLQWNRFVAKDGPLESLRQMAEVLRDGRTLTGTNQPVAVVYDGVRDTLRQHGLRPENLLQTSENLFKLLTDERPSANGFQQAFETAENLLNLIRVGTNADQELSQVIAAFNAESGNRVERLHAIAGYLQSLKINSHIITAGGDVPIPILNIEIGRMYTPLLERGRSVHLLLDAGTAASNSTELQTLMGHMERETDLIGLYVSSSLVSTRLPANLFASLEMLASQGNLIIPTGSTQFVRMLAERERFFDSIAELLQKTFKQLGTKNSRVAAVSIDSSISGYDREVLELAASQLRRGSPLECATRVGQLLEDVLRLNAQLVLCYGGSFGRKWDSAVHGSRLLSDPIFRGSLKDSIDLLRESRRLPDRDVLCPQGATPSDADLRFADETRDLRNKLTHETDSVAQAPELLKRVIAVVKSIGPQSKWHLVATMRAFDGSLTVVFSNGQFKSYSGFKIATSTEIAADSIYFLVKSDADSFVPFKTMCPRCGRQQAAKFDQNSTAMTCGYCRASMPKEGRLNHLRRLALAVQREVGASVSEIPNERFHQASGPIELAESFEPAGCVTIEQERQSTQFKQNDRDLLNVKETVRIFISYAHDDRKYLAKGSLFGYFQALERDHVQLWHDAKLIAGEAWDERIRAEISTCHIAVVLVSQAFLNSEYCRNVEISEFLKLRKAEGLRIFPVILSACEWHREEWLTSTQCLPSEGKNVELNFREKGKRLQLYQQILDHLRQLVEEIRKKQEHKPERPQ